jgi:hypothetical protein
LESKDLKDLLEIKVLVVQPELKEPQELLDLVGLLDL